VRLTILHTNDLHGRLEALPRLATLIQRERALAHHEGRRVLLLDAGDSAAKSSPDSLATQGRASFVLLEAAGYQAATLGNRDVKVAGAALPRLVAAVSFPVLAANLLRPRPEHDVAVPGLRRHAMLAVDGLRLGVAGLTAWAGYDYGPLGCRAVNGLRFLPDLIAEARAEGARAVVLLSHLGLAYDRRAAAMVGGLAAIVGGHSHTALERPVVVNGVPIVQAGAYGAYLGRLDLELEPETGRLLEHSGRLIPCPDDIPPDGTISATLELVREEAERVGRQRI
jgi:2',3'-cyclic-nucleotide 2'-phosphodiesterase (5'-nucleotidase family)